MPLVFVVAGACFFVPGICEYLAWWGRRHSWGTRTRPVAARGKEGWERPFLQYRGYVCILDSNGCYVCILVSQGSGAIANGIYLGFRLLKFIISR